MILKLLTIAGKADKSADRIVDEAKKKKIEALKIIYDDLPNSRLEELRKFNFCILRDAYQIGARFPSYLKTIASFFRKSHFFNNKMYEKHPFYEGEQYNSPQDKLFQHLLFKDSIDMLNFWHHDSVKKVHVESFPIVVKKRIGERGKEVFILNTKKEVEKFFRRRNINDYFFEEYLDIKKDVRALVLNHKFIGAVERRIRFKDNQGYMGVGVKVIDKYDLPENVIKKSILASKIIGSNLCGLDFGMDRNNKYYMLESNISPWFNGFERVLGINVAEKILDFILERVGSKS